MSESTRHRDRRLPGQLHRHGLNLVLILVLLAPPLLLNSFWVQTGLFVMASAVGAIGLTLLVGLAGQLSLGHAFFAALGAYTYAISAGVVGGADGRGFGVHPLLGLLLAAAVPAAAGLALSPISGRLRGIYLGLATVGLVFLIRHVLVNAGSWTGGYNGRSVADLRIGGFSFSNSSPDYLAVLGVQFGGLQRLWYAFLALLVLAVWIARNLRSSRTGRAFVIVRDSEVAASAAGVDVSGTKATAFVVSSAYAGLAGAMLSLAFGRVAPDVFGLQLSIDFLIMIVIGGLGSVRGAASGAAVVVALPLVLTQYSSSLPLLASPGSPGYDAATVTRLLYGVAIIAVLLFARGGLAGIARRLTSGSTATAPPSAAGGGDRPPGSENTAPTNASATAAPS